MSRRPRPIKYKDGYYVDFGNARAGRRVRKWFNRRKYPRPYEAALDFIDSYHTGETNEIPIRRAAAEYLRNAEIKKLKRPSTLKTDRSRLNIFIRYCSENNISSIQDLTVDEIRKFYSFYLENAPLYQATGEKPRRNSNPIKTWTKYRMILSALFRWCVEVGYMADNPIAGNKEFVSKAEKEQTIPRWFDDHELNQIFDYFDEHGDIYIRTWYRFLTYTGLRLSEALHLKWSDVDLKNKVLYVRKSKSYKPRAIPIHDELAEYLEAMYNKKHKYVFDDGRGNQRMSGDAYYKRLQTALRACNLAPAGLHAFRHTFGANLARGGAHAKEIQELMGHATEVMAMRYTHFAPRHLKRSIDNFAFKRD